MRQERLRPLYKEEEPLGRTGCLVLFLAFVALSIFPSALCWNYTVTYWMHYFGKPDTFHVWPQGVICSVIPGFGQLSFLAAGATFILSFFM